MTGIYKLLTNRKDLEIDFGKLCLEIREAMKISPEEMAEQLGTSLRNYQRWEAGLNQPHARAAYRLAEMHIVMRIMDTADTPKPKKK
ncbi:MAG: helix-turn-helix transcriptional regulator [Acidobacteriota bacterium]